jgi:hypothetical protein
LDDQGIVEFAFSLPDSLRWRGNDRRHFEREALGRLVPRIPWNRTGAEFTPAYRLQVESLPWRTTLLQESLVVREGWIEPDAFLAAHDAGIGDSLIRVWNLLAMDAWLRSIA